MAAENYNHLEIEKKWQQRWEEQGAFKALDDYTPVSYTHLDVYKRQILHSVRAAC